MPHGFVLQAFQIRFSEWMTSATSLGYHAVRGRTVVLACFLTMNGILKCTLVESNSVALTNYFKCGWGASIPYIAWSSNPDTFQTHLFCRSGYELSEFINQAAKIPETNHNLSSTTCPVSIKSLQTLCTKSIEVNKSSP